MTAVAKSRSKWIWIALAAVVAGGVGVYFLGRPWGETSDQLSTSDSRSLCVEAMNAAVSKTDGVQGSPQVKRVTFKDKKTESATVDGYTCEINPNDVGDWFLDDNHSIELQGWVTVGKNRKDLQKAYDSTGIENNCPALSSGPDTKETVDKWRDTKVCRVENMHDNAETDIATSAQLRMLSILDEYSVEMWLSVSTVRPDGDDTPSKDLVALSEADPKIRDNLRDLENAILDPVFDHFGRPVNA